MDSKEGIKGILLVCNSDCQSDLLAEKIKNGLHAYIDNIVVEIHNNQAPINDLIKNYYDGEKNKAAAIRKYIDEMLSNSKTPSPFYTYSKLKYKTAKPNSWVIACEVRDPEAVSFYREQGFATYVLNVGREFRCNTLIQTFPSVNIKDADELLINTNNDTGSLCIDKQIDIAVHASRIVSDQIKFFNDPQPNPTAQS
jgi:hypothetical protein